MSENDGFEEFMDRWTPEYHRPPETPREEIWEGIRAALRKEGHGRSAKGEQGAGEDAKVVSLPERRLRGARPLHRPWWAAAAAAAAVLVVGFGLGRLSAPGGPPAPPVLDVEPTGSVFRTAALGHFSESESFLTLVRGDVRAGRIDPGVGAWAQALLAETRLLLDSPAAEDPLVRSLLEDLELILVQVVGLEEETEAGGDRTRRELEILAAGMDDQDVLPRLQAMLPESPAVLGP